MCIFHAVDVPQEWILCPYCMRSNKFWTKCSTEPIFCLTIKFWGHLDPILFGITDENHCLTTSTIEHKMMKKFNWFLKKLHILVSWESAANPCADQYLQKSTTNWFKININLYIYNRCRFILEISCKATGNPYSKRKMCTGFYRKFLSKELAIFV